MFSIEAIKPLWYIFNEIFVFIGSAKTFGESPSRKDTERKTEHNSNWFHNLKIQKTGKTSSWTECVETWTIREKGNKRSDKIKSFVEFSEDCNIHKEIQDLFDQGFQFPMKVIIYKKESLSLEDKVKLVMLTLFLLWVASEFLSVESSLIVRILQFILRISVLSMAVQIYSWIMSSKVKRHRRGNPSCPSTNISPALIKDGNLKSRFAKLIDVEVSLNTETCDIIPDCLIYYNIQDSTFFPQNTRSSYLYDMSHQYLTLWEDLYVSFLLYPGAIWQVLFGNKYHGGITGFLVLKSKEYFGFTEECENSCTMLYHLIMETSLTTMVQNLETSEEGILMGTLILEGCCYLTRNHKPYSGTLTVELNISCRKILECTFTFDGKCQKISVNEALCLASNSLYGLIHPVIHCYSNWGTNAEIKSSKFLRLMSLITIKYNHMGASFKSFCGILHLLGRNFIIILIKYSSSHKSWIFCFAPLLLQILVNYQNQGHI